MTVLPTSKSPGDIGSANKTIRVFEQIIRFGPVSVAQICKNTGLSQPAVYRALEILRGHQWVVGQLGQGRYVATHSFMDQVTNMAFSSLTIEKIREDISNYSKSKDLHCDFISLSSQNMLELIESTDPNMAAAESEMQEETSILLAIFAATPPVRLVRLLARHSFFPGLDPEESATNIIKELTKNGEKRFWSAERNSVSIPVTGEGGELLALRIRTKPNKRNDEMALSQAAIFLEGTCRKLSS